MSSCKPGFKSDGEEPPNEIDNKAANYPVHSNRRSATAVNPVELINEFQVRDSFLNDVYVPLSARVDYKGHDDLLFAPGNDEAEFPKKSVRTKYVTKDRSQDLRVSMPVDKGDMEDRKEGRPKTERVKTRNSEVEGVKRWSRQNLNAISSENIQKMLIRSSINVKY